jgi:cephalosporin-C deacetylase-like acetyl esterase
MGSNTSSNPESRVLVVVARISSVDEWTTAVGVSLVGGIAVAAGGVDAGVQPARIVVKRTTTRSHLKCFIALSLMYRMYAYKYIL